MADRAEQVISDILRRIHEAIVENDVTYEEYQAAKQWFIDVGEAGEWPLFFDVYVEHVVEEHNAPGPRARSWVRSTSRTRRCSRRRSSFPTGPTSRATPPSSPAV
jgi:hypothetical protein